MKFLATLGALLASFSASAATVTPIATGLHAAIGQAYQSSGSSILFVEWSANQLSKLNLATHAVTMVHGGITNPEDVVTIPGSTNVYVTTRDGNIWRIDTAGSAAGIIASGLGAPHQMVLDAAAHQGYVVDFDGGNLWKVNLTTGTKIAILTGLNHPVGLKMSSDFKHAFISEQGTNTIADFYLPSLSRTEIAAGLTNPFFLEWADDAHSALYFTQRDPINKVFRLDLATSPATLFEIASVPFRPSSVVRTADPSILYVASDSEISKVDLTAGIGGPVITRLGFIPSTSIDFTNGLATTVPSYFFVVKNAAFGSTVHVMLNFPHIRAVGARYYRVSVDAGSPEFASWVNYKWNGSTFLPHAVMPNPSGFYSVPGASELFAIPDLGFSWNTTTLTNARHVVHVYLYDALFHLLAPNGQVAAAIDNQAPTMHIDQILHDGVPINECALITTGSPNFSFTFTAFEGNGHLYNYDLVDQWGHGNSASITGDHYIGVHDGSTTWFGVNPTTVAYAVSNTHCAHDFRLGGWGNSINGYGYNYYSSDFDTVAIYLGGTACSERMSK